MACRFIQSGEMWLREACCRADELAMARMRLRVHVPGEAALEREINHNVLHPAEVPVRNKVG